MEERMREYTRTGRRMGEEDIDAWRDRYDRDGCMPFAEVIRIIKSSRNGYGYRDELEM